MEKETLRRDLDLVAQKLNVSNEVIISNEFPMLKQLGFINIVNMIATTNKIISVNDMLQIMDVFDEYDIVINWSAKDYKLQEYSWLSDIANMINGSAYWDVSNENLLINLGFTYCNDSNNFYDIAYGIYYKLTFDESGNVIVCDK